MVQEEVRVKLANNEPGQATPADSDCSTEIWALLGEKAGDNNQVLALVEALGHPYQTRQLKYRKTELLTNLLLQRTLLGVDKKRSEQLSPPWPALVIASGRRSEPVAQWIKKQSRGYTRLVHLGRPWQHPRNYDLIISTPQYSLADEKNVLVNTLPLHRMKEKRLQQAAVDWRTRLEKYAPPYTILMAGGNSGAYIFDRNAGNQIGKKANQLVKNEAGSLLVTSSGRTPAELIDGIMDAIEVPHYLYRWKPDDNNNPYLAFLALADRIIVTGESISMLAEALSTGKPVYIYHPKHLYTRPGAALRKFSWAAFSHGMTQHLAPARFRRDISPLLDHLVKNKHATWLENDASFKPIPLEQDDLSRAATAVQQLLG